MRTNLEMLKKQYEEKFKGGLYDNLKNIDIRLNSRKEDMGKASLSINMVRKTGDSLSATLYIVEKNQSIIVLFVNDNTKDIVYSNTSENAVESAEKYVESYFTRSLSRMMNIEIKDGSVPRKERKRFVKPELVIK